MNHIEFRRRMMPLSVFSLRDVYVVEPCFDRRRLHEWHKKGYVRLLANGWYLFSDIPVDENSLDWIANRLYAPSYISLETVLSRTGLIPETVPTITSITTRKTRKIRTTLAFFTYRTVSPRFFFGYDIGPHGVKTAFAEKAVLDYLYLHADLVAQEDFEGLRIDNAEISGRFNMPRFNDFLLRFNSKALTIRATKFMKWTRYA
jgi:predicted transcriptional regulator of viral defense system